MSTTWPRHQGTVYVRPTSAGRVPAEAYTSDNGRPRQKDIVLNPSPAPNIPRAFTRRVGFLPHPTRLCFHREPEPLRSLLTGRRPVRMVRGICDSSRLEGGASASESVKPGRGERRRRGVTDGGVGWDTGVGARVRSRSLLGTQRPPGRTEGSSVSLWAAMDGTIKYACQIKP